MLLGKILCGLFLSHIMHPQCKVDPAPEQLEEEKAFKQTHEYVSMLMNTYFVFYVVCAARSIKFIPNDFCVCLGKVLLH